MLIGLTGFGGVGKDTAAAYLVREYGFSRLSFADKLRELAYAANPPLVSGHRVTGNLRDIVDYWGWDRAKREFPSVRECLQGIGQAHRDVLGEDFWLDMALPKHKGVALRAFQAKRYVVTDVRYPNEAKRIRDLGGQVIRVERPGHGPVNGHVSESELFAETVLHNTRHEEYLHYQLDLIVGIDEAKKESA